VRRRLLKSRGEAEKETGAYDRDIDGGAFGTVERVALLTVLEDALAELAGRLKLRLRWRYSAFRLVDQGGGRRIRRLVSALHKRLLLS
jgi:hypothetical protein